jgi:transcriptional regulator with XRE-family HTH domain
VGKFAEKAGWSRNKASRILNGKQEPDAKDITVLVDVLQIESTKTFLQIFFPDLYTKWTNEIDKEAS